MESEQKSETLHTFNLSLKQLAKDRSWIVDSLKVRGNTAEELQKNLTELLEISLKRLKELNGGIKNE